MATGQLGTWQLRLSHIMPMPNIKLSIRGSMLAVAFLGLATSFIAIPFRSAAEETKCQENLRAIGLALNSYHATYSCFPPAYTTDAQGKPLHSWRVLLLPFAGEDALYRDVRLDEPWNSPHNAKLLKRMPRFYACPTSAGGSQASYAAVVGKDLFFPESGCTSITQIVDGTSNTISVVEIEGNGIPWMEPRDLKLIAPSGRLEGQEWTDFMDRAGANLYQQGLAGRNQHPRGANRLYADGQARADRNSDQIFYTRLTINGAEVWCIEEY